MMMVVSRLIGRGIDVRWLIAGGLFLVAAGSAELKKIAKSDSRKSAGAAGFRENVRIPIRIPASSVSFRRPKTRFRGNVWVSGTQIAFRKTCDFPGASRSVTYRSYDDSPEKCLRLWDCGKYDRLIVPPHRNVPGCQNRAEPRLCAVKTRRPQGGVRPSGVRGEPYASAADTVFIDANRWKRLGSRIVEGSA
jgi:hypothetical protein